METDERERPSVRRLTDFSQIETLYRTRLKRDFVRSELRPLASLRSSWEQNAYECYGLFGGDDLLGYAFFVRLGKSCLLDYFAVAAARRDEGLGSLFLQMLASFLADADCVIVEVEDPDKAPGEKARAERERRLRFYLRSGWLQTGLRSRLFGVDYRILELPTSGAHSTQALRSIYADLYRSILPGLLFRTQLRVF